MLRDELKNVTPTQRKFLTLRIATLDLHASLKLCGVTHHAYNSWVKQTRFTSVYHRLNELSAEYKDEAILLLRDENYLAIVSLEKEMIEKIRQEIRDGEPVFARTHLGREIYARLATEMSRVPKVQSMTWEQLVFNQPVQLPQGTTVEGEYEEVNSKTESSES